mmetsp:Transcript_45761/g.83826  ORF Transcript_45761/g.83826 Transcript_45761/m.83826 type:complete len:277 (-) Transcript_45761:11-841(-)
MRAHARLNLHTFMAVSFRRSGCLQWLLLSGMIHIAAGRISGIHLRGDASANVLPEAAFGADDASSTAVVMKGGSLEVQRCGHGAQMILSDAVVSLPNVQADGDLSMDKLFVEGMPQWALWSLETFDGEEETTEWSLNDRGFCGTPHDSFLGGHCRFAASTTARRYANLPEHTKARIRARVHFIDNWNGESVLLVADEAPVWSHSHSWCPLFLQWMCTKHGIDSCGRDTPDLLSVHAEVLVDHNASTLDIAFTSSLPHGTDACYTSWAVDDVSLELL